MAPRPPEGEIDKDFYCGRRVLQEMSFIYCVFYRDSSASAYQGARYMSESIAFSSVGRAVDSVSKCACGSCILLQNSIERLVSHSMYFKILIVNVGMPYSNSKATWTRSFLI